MAQSDTAPILFDMGPQPLIYCRAIIQILVSGKVLFAREVSDPAFLRSGWIQIKKLGSDPAHLYFLHICIVCYELTLSISYYLCK